MKADFTQSINIVLHSKLPYVVGWLIAGMIASVLLAAQFSARQPQTVALDVGFSVIRVTLPMLAILLVQELISREFERKHYLNSLTYPRSRSSWLLGRGVAIFTVCLAFLAVQGLVLALLIPLSTDYTQTTSISLGAPFVITLLFIALDLMVVIAISMLLAVSASTPSIVLIGTIGFVLIARAYTPIIELLSRTPSVVKTFADPHLYQNSLSMLTFVLPDLGRLDVRMIALYDKMRFLPENWLLLVIATLAYIWALQAITVWILNKREFN